MSNAFANFSKDLLIDFAVDFRVASLLFNFSPKSSQCKLRDVAFKNQCVGIGLELFIRSYLALAKMLHGLWENYFPFLLSRRMC